MSDCPCCRHCGSWGTDCPIAVCEGCGTPQCHRNGTRAGTCRICFHGYLSGWSKGMGGVPVCGYARCNNPALFRDVPRVGCCCRACWGRPRMQGGVSLREYVLARVEADAWRHLRLRDGELSTPEAAARILEALKAA